MNWVPSIRKHLGKNRILALSLRILFIFFTKKIMIILGTAGRETGCPRQILSFLRPLIGHCRRSGGARLHFISPAGTTSTRSDQVEALQKESGRRLCYIHSRCTSMDLFQVQVAPLVLKFGIHQGQAGRKGVSRGKEEGKRGGEGWKASVVWDFTTLLDWAAVYYPQRWASLPPEVTFKSLPLPTNLKIVTVTSFSLPAPKKIWNG
jgi:hypothetical protein